MSRPRRQRYAFTVNVGRETTTLHVLAYDQTGAIQTIQRHADARGWTVLSGPERIRKRNADAPVQAWNVDPRALAEAKRELSLQWPVKIRRTTGQSRVGSYRLVNGVHTICVSHARPVADANRTLWHELTHAAQAEREGSPEAWRLRCAREKRIPYRQRPIEREAFAAMHRGDTHPILKIA